MLYAGEMLFGGVVLSLKGIALDELVRVRPCSRSCWPYCAGGCLGCIVKEAGAGAGWGRPGTGFRAGGAFMTSADMVWCGAADVCVARCACRRFAVGEQWALRGWEGSLGGWEESHVSSSSSR